MECCMYFCILNLVVPIRSEIFRINALFLEYKCVFQVSLLMLSGYSPLHHSSQYLSSDCYSRNSHLENEI